MSLGRQLAQWRDQAARGIQGLLGGQQRQGEQADQGNGARAEDAARTRQRQGSETPLLDEAGSGVGSAAGAAAGAAAQRGPVYHQPAAPQDRAAFTSTYITWLQARLPEVQALAGQARVQRVEGLLGQIEDVVDRFNRGVPTDISRLSTTPRGGGAARETGFVPAEMIPTVRGLIRLVEQPVDGAERQEGADSEASAYSGVDWNSRLGVPQYRDQRDNLIDGDVTCNVTTFSMMLERLGYGREAVLAALQRQVKRSQARGNAGLSDAELDAMALDEAAWARAVRNYAGANVDPATFAREAQMEVLLDLMVKNLRGKKDDRYAISEDYIGGELLGLVAGEGNDAPTQDERLWQRWSTVKPTIEDHLRGGGAVMLSLDIGSSTHLVSCQQVTGSGAILDDPYGQIRASYRGRGHAYSGGREGDTRNTRGGEERGWTAGAAQVEEASELRGDSATVEDVVMSSCFQYAQLYHRAGSRGANA